MMAKIGPIAKDTLLEPERLAVRAIDWDQSDRGLSSGRAAISLQSRRRIHGHNRNYASISRNALAPREPSIQGSSGSPNGQHRSRWQAVLSISSKIGCAPQTLNDWLNKAEVNSGKRAGVTSEMSEKMKALERENRELRRANEILRKTSAYFALLEGSAASLRAMPERLDRRHKR
jgi:transposase-like protein